MGNMEDKTYALAQTSDTNDGFFERPTKIAEYTWTIGAALTQTFNPWALFLTNPRVVNRLAYFKLFRAKMHVRFLINGGPFYWGMAMASYVPRPKNDQISTMRNNMADICQASQRPHVFLDPTRGIGGELELPFFHESNYLDITSNSYNDMGTIVLESVNLLNNLDVTADGLTISVFAWCSDVDLSVPTAESPAGLVAQSGKESKDEYGIVSGPAHTLANISGKVADMDIPGIFPYARATQLAAKAVGGIARLFGYSKPLTTHASTYYSPLPGGMMATTDGTTLAVPLSADPKKEVTIDPRTVGLDPVDEMLFVNIAKREAFLGAFSWSGSGAADTLVFNTRVSPLIGVGDQGTPERVQLTPMAHVVMPFKYWTGSMEFRIQIVASAFHRGRLRLVYDPGYYPETKYGDYNLGYSEIVDISDGTEFTVKIGWGQDQSYLPVGGYDKLSTQCTSVPFTVDDYFSNGTLSCIIVNPLTAGNETIAPSVGVNVFAKMCDDFEVAYFGGSSELPKVTINTEDPPVIPESATEYYEDPHPYDYDFWQTTDPPPAGYGGFLNFQDSIPGSPDRGGRKANANWQTGDDLKWAVHSNWPTWYYFNASSPRDPQVDADYSPEGFYPNDGDYVVIETDANLIESTDYPPSDPVETWYEIDTVAAPKAFSTGLNLWKRIEYAGMGDHYVLRRVYPKPVLPAQSGREVRYIDDFDRVYSQSGVAGSGVGEVNFSCACCAKCCPSTRAIKRAFSRFSSKCSSRPPSPSSVCTVCADNGGIEVLPAQSGTEGGADLKAESDDNKKPVDLAPSTTMATADYGPANTIFFGEQLTSIRQVLKRYIPVLSVTGIGSDTILKMPVMPNPWKELTAVPAALTDPGATITPTFANGENAFTWFTSGFAGYRGSCNAHFNMLGYTRCADIGMDGAISGGIEATCSIDNATKVHMMQPSGWQHFSGMDGATTAAVNFPWYENLRFKPAREFRENPNVPFRHVFRVPDYALLMSAQTSTSDAIISYSAGEDFALFFYVSAPAITAVT